MNENFKDVRPTPLTKQDVTDDDEHVLWEKESILGTEQMCGFGPCRGPALQGLANRRLYLIVFCALSVIQGMYYSYVISVLTTIEKRFAVPSRITGLLMTGNEFSQITFAVVVAYFGSQGHRPRWVAVGMFISAVSCFVSAVPEFMFPSLEPTIPHGDTCRNHTSSNITDPPCTLPVPYTSARTATFIIFFGLFFSGVGSITLYSLGLPYMDDNTSKKKSPAYIGIVAGLRMVGPTLGFLLGAYCTSQHIRLEEVGIEVHEPRWVGAWWLGFVVIGLLLLLGGLFIAPFPQILPSTVVEKVNEESHLNSDVEEMDFIKHVPSVPRLGELPTALWRLVSNSLFMVYTVGGVFHLLGTVGFFTFLPKYLESQFRQSASSANTIAGFAGFFVMILSTIASGFVIQHWRPRARLVSGWLVAVTLLQVAGLLVCMQITCDSKIQGLQPLKSHMGQFDLNNDCNSDCQCTTKKFSPVCDTERKLNYFSACHLGCSSFNTTSQSYENCSCVAPLSTKGRTTKITSNYCDSSCQSLVLYVAILAIIKFSASSCHVGSILISLRCIEARDKGLAMGFLNTIYCLCAFLPCTVIYGSLVDSACEVWEESCGRKGNCWVYDPDRLRHLLHGVTAGLLTIGMIFDAYLCYQSKRISLYEETTSLSPKPVKLGDMVRRTK